MKCPELSVMVETLSSNRQLICKLPTPHPSPFNLFILHLQASPSSFTLNPSVLKQEKEFDTNEALLVLAVNTLAILHLHGKSISHCFSLRQDQTEEIKMLLGQFLREFYIQRKLFIDLDQYISYRLDFLKNFLQGYISFQEHCSMVHHYFNQ